MEIKDGTGTGNKVAVSANNRLKTLAVSQSSEHFSNVTDGTAWSLVFSQTATGANDNIFYFENTGTETYIFEGFDYRTASAESLLIVINNVGTPSGGTTLTPVNLNSGSAKIPTATIESGNNITGLSGGSTAYKIYMTSTATEHYNFDQDIVIEPGGTLTIQAVTGGVAVDFNIDFHQKGTE